MQLNVVMQFCPFRKYTALTYIIDVLEQMVLVFSTINSCIGQHLTDIRVLCEIVIEPFDVVAMIQSVQNLKF